MDFREYIDAMRQIKNIGENKLVVFKRAFYLLEAASITDDAINSIEAAAYEFSTRSQERAKLIKLQEKFKEHAVYLKELRDEYIKLTDTAA